MSHVYQNPPVIEAVCEFKFAPVAGRDVTLPGLLWESFREAFPVKEQHDAVEFVLQPGQAPLVKPVTRLRFLRSDSTALVQVNDDTLIINQLRPYPNWDVFAALIKEQLARYVRVAQPTTITSVALRYINRLELPNELNDAAFQPCEYCCIIPCIPADLMTGGAAVSINQSMEITRLQYNGRLVLQSGNAVAEAANAFAFLLDLSFASLDAIPIEQVGGWIEQAHQQIEDAFYVCYTDKAKELF